MKADEAPLATLKGVTKWFGSEQVLRGADLELRRGSVTAILARNGAGKSTLMRILLGLLARDGGEAQVLGKDPEDLGIAERERIAWVTDTTTGWMSLKVSEELSLMRSLRGDRWSREREQELLERFEVPLNKRLGALSKGLQTRVRLVAALAAEPELLLLDEPALGLDLFARHDFLETIIETVTKEGRAVLIASHLLDDVERIADRIAFLRQGVVQVEGTLDELRERFRRVRVTVGPRGPEALEVEAPALLGVLGVKREAGDPQGERVVVCNDHSAGLAQELENRTGAKVLETRRMTLREIYLEVLAGREEEVSR